MLNTCYTCEKLTMTGRTWATQSWGSNNFPRAAQPSTANKRTESWSEIKNSLKKVTSKITTFEMITEYNDKNKM